LAEQPINKVVPPSTQRIQPRKALSPSPAASEPRISASAASEPRLQPQTPVVAEAPTVAAQAPVVEQAPVVGPQAPVTFDLGQPVADLHGSNEPVTWAGASIELVTAEHRPASALDRDPARSKWMTWAIGGTVAFVLILGFALTRGGDAEAGEAADPQAKVEIPSAPEEPPPAPVTPEPEPTKKDGKKKSGKRDSTLASSSKPAGAATSKPAAGGASKPAASTSKPAAGGASKPAASTSKPAAGGASKPANEIASKPAGPNLAPPEEDAGGAKAELPDVQGWDDQDAAVGDRSAEGV
jgi:hypothetical protein